MSVSIASVLQESLHPSNKSRTHVIFFSQEIGGCYNEVLVLSISVADSSFFFRLNAVLKHLE